MPAPFVGRTISVVADLSPDEQWYLYTKTREAKAQLEKGETAAHFRVTEPDRAVYLLFMDQSTRTKESFRNAAQFHKIKVNDFDTATSSFNKKESITDTVKMLSGYSFRQSVFVVRSKIEGVCRALEVHLRDHARRMSLPAPIFINAGDGRHGHPTHELLDQFSLLEHTGFDRSRIHLALCGDLVYSRTALSKVDGLRIFHEVHVDLVAPPEISLPEPYVSRMQQQGFVVRKFGHIRDYLKDASVARLWYFTSLNISRFGEQFIEREPQIRDAITFKEQYLESVSPETRFLTTGPDTHPSRWLLPPSLDYSHVNAWDRQLANGYYVRVVLLAMLMGKIGDDFQGQSPVALLPQFTEAEYQPASAEPQREEKTKTDFDVGIRRLSSGVVIDHIAAGETPGKVWDVINMVRRVLKFNVIGSHGVHESSSGKCKGLISLPDHPELSQDELRRLAAVAPKCTVNIIVDNRVCRKYRLAVPPAALAFADTRCANPACISHPQHHESVVPAFTRTSDSTVKCRYCDREQLFTAIWVTK